MGLFLVLRHSQVLRSFNISRIQSVHQKLKSSPIKKKKKKVESNPKILLYPTDKTVYTNYIKHRVI